MRIEAQTWGNTPPYTAVTMYRKTCCGLAGLWFRYRDNAKRERCTRCGR